MGVDPGRKQRRKDRIAAGLCSECGKARGEDGTQTMCRACADAHKRRSKKHTYNNIANGVCACGKEKDPEAFRCPACAEYHKHKSRRLRRKRSNSHRCIRCGRTIEEGLSRKSCSSCLESKKAIEVEKRTRRIAKGLCVMCATPLLEDRIMRGRVTCSNCAEDTFNFTWN